MTRPAFRPAIADIPEPPSRTPMGVLLLSFFCGILVTVLGGKSALQDWRAVRKLTHLDAFVETPGKLLRVAVRGDSGGSSGDYYPDVLYEYSVEGRGIWGWRLSYEDEPKPEQYWKERLSGYRVGATVPVYFNPEEPKDSIVERRRDSLYRTIMKMGLGLLFLLAGCLLAALPVLSWIRRDSRD